jgi:hypothetical protein
MAKRRKNRQDGEPKPSEDAAVEAANSAVAPQARDLDVLGMASSFYGDVPTNEHKGAGWVTYETLDAMAMTPFVAPIISTRLHQIAEFCQRQPDRHSAGFKVVLRDREREPTKAEKVRAREIEDLVLAAGGKYGPGSFEGFVRAFMNDSLVFDQGNFEILRNRAGQVVGFKAADAATMRRGRPTAEAMRTGVTDYAAGERYVQVIDSRIVREFTSDEMAWCVRRPRTRIRHYGYGNPELAEVVTVLVDLMNAQAYNSTNFSNGISTNIMLAVMANMNPTSWKVMKEQMTAKLSGVGNSRRVPMVLLNPGGQGRTAEDIKPIKLGESNRDMEFGQHISFNLKLMCAGMAMDPAELGYVYGSEGQTATLSDKGPEERVVASKERGLRPKLRSLERWMNHHIIGRVDPDFELIFTGYDALSREARIQLDMNAVKHFRTINEIRRENDWQDIDSPWANMILDPTVINSEMARLAQEEEGQGPDGEGGGSDDEDPDQGPEPGADPFGAFGGDDDEGEGEPATMEKASRNLVTAFERAHAEGRVGLIGNPRRRSKLTLGYQGERMIAVEVGR